MGNAIAMFHKRSRQSSDEPPGAERWRHHMEELFLSNQVSAPEVRDMFEDGTVMKVQQTINSAKAGKYGKYPNNVKRDMLRAAMKDKKDWPPLYYIEVEIINTATQTVGLKKLPIILPHEFIFFCKEKMMMLSFFLRRTWDKQPRLTLPMLVWSLVSLSCLALVCGVMESLASSTALSLWKSLP
jgi:hypothetical protein